MLPMAAWAALSWHGAAQLVRPPRRGLEPHHRDLLADPAAHGMRVDSLTLTDGTPVLVCGPARAASAKGERLRTQLAADGIALPPSGTVRANLVLLHGRRGRKEDWLPAAERFCAVGFRCLLPDLPGHGDHPVPVAGYGVPEAQLPGLVLRECAARGGFPEAPAALIGISMGGAVALHAAAVAPGDWQCLAVISTFDALENAVAGQAEAMAGRAAGGLWLAGTRVAWRMMAGRALDEVESVRAAGGVRLPVLVAHGTADRVIPMACGQRLFGAVASSDKRWVEVPGADHHNVLVTDFPLYATLARWSLERTSP